MALRFKHLKSTAEHFEISVEDLPRGHEEKVDELKKRILNFFISNGFDFDFECEKCKNDIPDIPFCPWCHANLTPAEPEKVSSELEKIPTTPEEDSARFRGFIYGRFDYKDLLKALEEVVKEFDLEIKKRKIWVSYFMKKGHKNIRIFSVEPTRFSYTMYLSFEPEFDHPENYFKYNKSESLRRKLGRTVGIYKAATLQEAVEVARRIALKVREPEGPRVDAT